MQVIPAIQRTAHCTLYVGKASRIQHTGHLGGDAAVPCHHTVRRKIIQRLIQHAQAAGRVFSHAPAAQGCELKVRGLGAVELVQGVLLKKQRIAHAGGRSGKRPITAHRDGIAVRCDAPVGEPVGGVAQFTGIDHVFLAAAAPHPVVTLGDVVQIRHAAFHPHRRTHRKAAGLFAVQTGPPGTVRALHQCAVKAFTLRCHLHPQAVFQQIIHHQIAVPFFPHPGLLRRRARHRHGVPRGKQLLCACCRDAAIVQRHCRPVAGGCAVHLQRAGAAPRVLLILHL